MPYAHFPTGARFPGDFHAAILKIPIVGRQARGRGSMEDFKRSNSWYATLRNFMGEICANMICFCPHFYR